MGFLIDNTNPNLVHDLPGALSLKDAKLEQTAEDSVILEVALDKQLTIVTNNERHFSELMWQKANRSGLENCTGDGFGLVVPNQQRHINYADLTKRLKMNGQKVQWADVSHFNLKVSLNGGDPILSPLPRCKFDIAECSSPKTCDYAHRFKALGLMPDA